MSDKYEKELAFLMWSARLTYHGYDEEYINNATPPPELLEQYEYQISVLLYKLKRDNHIKESDEI